MRVFVLIFGMLGFAINGVLSDGDCPEAKAPCVSNLMLYLHDRSYNLTCEQLRENKDCLVNFAEKCLNEAEKATTQKTIDEMARTLNAVCGSSEMKNATEMLECSRTTQNLHKSFVDACIVETSMQRSNITDGLIMPMTAFGERADLNCESFLAGARCVSKKVGDTCGSILEKPFLHGMMKSLVEQNPQAAQVPQCLIALLESESHDESEGTQMYTEYFSYNII